MSFIKLLKRNILFTVFNIFTRVVHFSKYFYNKLINIKFVEKFYKNTIFSTDNESTNEISRMLMRYYFFMNT